MPTRPSKGVKGIYVELPPALVEQMRALAQRNGRPFREEAEHAFVRHLASPPTIRVETDVPALDAADAQAAAEPKRPRGQPKSVSSLPPAL
jgi:hypothetical protein